MCKMTVVCRVLFFCFGLYNVVVGQAAYQTRTHDAAASRDSAIGAAVGTLEGKSRYGETATGVKKKKECRFCFLLCCRVWWVWDIYL